MSSGEKPLSQLKLESGDVLYYLGEKRVLTVIREQRSRARIICVMDRLLMYAPYEADYEWRQRQLEKWYRREAQAVFGQKAAEYAGALGVQFQEIRIKDQKSRWGSCSSLGNLNFNWRLLMAPEPVCDYVIIHELCHLIHMDHSPDFWREVERLCPAHKEYRKWLREQGKLLYIF